MNKALHHGEMQSERPTEGAFKSQFYSPTFSFQHVSEIKML